MRLRALCYDTWSEVALLINRLSVLAIAMVGLYTVISMCRKQPPCRQKRLIPRPVLVFSAAWFMSLILLTSFIILSPCDNTLPVTFHVMYGVSLIWALAGMIWITGLGNRAHRDSKLIAPTEEEVVAVMLQQVAEFEAEQSPQSHLDEEVTDSLGTA